jgi:hypothetical protein
MSVDLSDVELGFVVSLGALREAIKELNVDGRRWWLSSDPEDAVETGYVSIAHGTVGAYDRLNTLHFRVPVVGNVDSNRSTDRLILLVDPSSATAEEAGFYRSGGRINEDPVEDLYSFYDPIERALIARLNSRNQ